MRSNRLLVATLTIAALAGCGGGDDDTTATTPESSAAEANQPADESAASGGELVIGRITDIEGLNPGDYTGNETLRLGEQLYDTLVRPKVDGSGLEPGLATEWTVSDDGLTYTFTLRDGVTFHDGTPMTAADVVFSIEQARTGEIWGSQYAAIDTVTSPDASTIVVSLSKVDTDILNVLGFTPSGVIPADYGGQTKEAFYAAPIGTGPFSFVSWSPGTEVVLDANPDWWGGAPKVDRVVYRIVADDNARVLQLENGELDIVELLPLTAVDTLTSATAYFADPSARTDLISLNSAAAPTDDANLREAINLVIDRDEIVAGALNGHGSPASTLLPANFETVVPQAVSADLEAAQAAMAASAYPDGTSLDYMYIAGDQAAATTAEILKAQLAQIGIDLVVQPLDYGAWLDNLFAGTFQAAGVFFTADMPTAGPSIQFFLDTGGFASLGALDEAAAAHEAFVANDDLASQTAAVESFEQAVRAFGAIIPLYHPTSAYGVGEGVSGFVVSPMQQYRLADISVGG